MLTVRLPDHLERHLEAQRAQRSSFELGEALFGRYGSGESTRSTTYKRRVRACEASWLTRGP